MKGKGFLTALFVILVPISIDLLVRSMMVNIKTASTDTLSSRFLAAYLQALPFYITYVLLVLLVLSLYNHNKSKNKSH